MEINTVIQILKENQYRITLQRKIILNILFENKNTLLTIDALLALCQDINPAVNATTVYRNIELLDDLELLYKTNINRNTTAYKLICSHHHHHHITCLSCGKLVAIDYCPITPSLDALVEENDFVLTDHQLELYGYCGSCKEF